MAQITTRKLMAPEGTSGGSFSGRSPLEGKKQIRALVVDDDEQQLTLSKKTFLRKNCGVSGAQSGEEALEILKTQQFDVILLDFNMPGMNGGELFKLLTDEQKKTVIFNTGLEANTEELLLTGRPVLAKPYGSKELYEAVSSIVGPLE